MLRKLDKYELLEEIGHGGMATVYRVRDTRLNRAVALKILHPHLQKTPEARKRFSREAQSVAKLKHPNILEIYDYSGDDSEESYIAAELLTGPTLKVLVEEGGALPPEVAAAFTIQIARALQSAHEGHIVHRDVKPENVLLHEDRILKLTDFGIAQMVDSTFMTATGQLLGSPGHMAPEQISAGEIDERSDIFALGTVLYFMATGRLPFTGRNPHQILKRIVDAKFPDPLRVNPAIGEELAVIIRRAMAGERDQRQQSANALEAELTEFLAKLGIDDPDALVVTYLADAETEKLRLHQSATDVLTERARVAVQTGDRQEALRCLNRVLAIDDGNAEALALVDKLAHDQKPAWLWAGVAALMLASIFGVRAAACDDPTGQGADGGLADAAVPDASPEDLGTADVGADSGADSRADSTDQPDAEDPTAVADVGPLDVNRDRGSRMDHRTRPNLPRGPRLVKFRPFPQRVSIGVDGATPRAFGPAFHEVELDPGVHTFRFVGAANCCEELEFRATIPPGNSPFILTRRMVFRPSRLMVRSTVLPARVQVEAGGPDAPATSGAANSLFRVPLGALRQSRRITVRAEGHLPVTRQVQLSAGGLVQIDVAPQPLPE